MTNREIDQTISSISSGSAEALKDLYLSLKKPVFIMAFTLSKNKSIAEDVVQDTFVTVYEKSRSYQPRGSGKAWVLAIAGNITKQYLSRDSKYCLVDEPGESAVSHQLSFEETIEQNIHARQVLDRLGVKERDIVILHVLVGLKLRQVAEALNLPRGSVYWSYSNALKKMKKVYYDEKGMSDHEAKRQNF